MGRVNVRVDDQLKNDSQKILSSLGLDLTTAIKIFLRQVVIHEGLPFEVKLEKEYYTTEEVMGENWRDGLEDIPDEWE